MTSSIARSPLLTPTLRRVLIGLLVVGIVFRFVNLSHKVYWHDEAYTSLRAAGYTRQEIDQTLFQNQRIAIGDLQRFQQIKLGSTTIDTVRSLAIEDPQHPPFYFLLARGWMQGWGGSIVASRLLPALLSLLALPAMYALAWELFASHSVALLATTLLSLSPFDVLFAQTARQYSLLTVLVIVSQWLLLRALGWGAAREPRSHLQRPPRKSTLGWTVGYGVAAAIGLYTHPFFALTLVAQMGWVILGCWMQRGTERSPWRGLGCWGLAVGGAIGLYVPWLVVMLGNVQRATATTDWTRVFPGWEYLLKLWTLSFTALFLDLDFGFTNPLTFGLRVPIVLLFLLSGYTLVRRCPPIIWLSVLTSILVPFLLLAVPDLVLGGKRSAVSRYLISSYPGVQLAMAYWLTTHLATSRQYFRAVAVRGQTFGQSLHTLWQRVVPARRPYSLAPVPLLPLQPWFWRSVLALLVAGMVASGVASAAAFTWWDKDVSYFNFAIAERLKTLPEPILVSDLGDDYTNTGDLISLSYRLDPRTPALLVAEPNWTRSSEFKTQIQNKTAVVFRPSQKLRQTLEQSYGPLQPLLPAARLWQIRRM